MVWKRCNCRKKHRVFPRVCMTAALIWMAGLLAGCGASREAVAETQDDPGITSPETTLPESDMSVDGSDEETTEPDVVEIETGAAETESDAEDTVQYDCEPISYDLTQLLPMENKLYAEWEGKIYYRQYSDEDMEEGALWAEFAPVADTEKELMRMEPDGTVTQVGVDYGYGTLFIVDGRLYSQRHHDAKSYQGSGKVYSSRLDGTDVAEYDAVETLAVRNNGVLCRTANHGLAFIDAQTGQEHILVDTWVYYLDATAEEVFYFGYQKTGATDEDEPTLYSVDYKGNISPLKTITCEEYLEYADDVLFGQYPIDIPYFEIVGDELYFAAGSYNGNGHMYSGGSIYSMKKDGSDCRVEAFSYDYYFYLYDDGENRAVYFYDNESEPHQCSVKSLLGEVPQDTVIPADVAYDRPFVHNKAGSILFYPDTSGTCYMLLTKEEAEELSIELYVDHSRKQKICDIEYLDGKLFFTVTDLTYSTEYSIGWRDGYERGKSACYCKDLASGDIRLLYEYGG